MTEAPPEAQLASGFHTLEFVASGRELGEPDDALDENLVLRRRLVLTLAVVTSVLATLWGVAYWLYDKPPAAFLVWGYTGLTLLNVWVFRAGGGYKPFARRQLLLVLVAPFVLSLLLGGAAVSGTVIVWSLVAPLAALAIGEPTRARPWWFGAFALFVVLSGVRDLVPGTNPLPDGLIATFRVMNLVGAGSVAMLLLAAFSAALVRQRAALAQHVDVLERHNRFSGSLARTLDPEDMFTQVVTAVAAVIPSDAVSLSVLASAGAGLTTVAEHGTPPGPVGEDLVQRALQMSWPLSVDGAAVVALRPAGEVTGTLSVFRSDSGKPFGPLELDLLGRLAAEASLAIANALLHAEVKELAIRDPLTGLHNRRYFEAALDQLLALRRRTAVADRHPLAAIAFDLDDFGRFNKQHGSAAGDAVLRAFGEVLGETFREADLVARTGGEEFTAILDGASRDDAMRKADGVRRTFESLIIQGTEGPLRATVSGGCAELASGEVRGETLTQRADVALSMAKRGGRNQIVSA